MIKHSDILQLCRLCLVEEKVNHSIFEETGDLRGILLKITSCLPVSISQDDSLPKRICETCFTKLDSYYKFWNDSANAEKQLLQWLSQTTLGTISKTGQGDINKSRMDKAEIKEETIDLEDGKLDSLEMSTDAKTYILQQQQLPYSVATPKILPSETNETDEPASKRPRRASAMKALEHMESEDEDDDLDDGADAYAKGDTDDSDKEDENYQEGPSTSMDDQPGPSGVGKGTTEASSFPNLLAVKPCAVKLIDISYMLDEDGVYIVPSKTGKRTKNFTCYKCFQKFRTADELEIHKVTHEDSEDEPEVADDSDDEKLTEMLNAEPDDPDDPDDMYEEDDELPLRQSSRSTIKIPISVPSRSLTESQSTLVPSPSTTPAPSDSTPSAPSDPTPLSPSLSTKSQPSVPTPTTPTRQKPSTPTGSTSAKKKSPSLSEKNNIPSINNIHIKCGTCDMIFTNSEQLFEHVPTKPDKPCSFVCKVCSESHSSPLTYMNHILQHNAFIPKANMGPKRDRNGRNGRKYLCSKCDERFEDCYQLRRHEIGAHDKKKDSMKRSNKNKTKSHDKKVDNNDSETELKPTNGDNTNNNSVTESVPVNAESIDKNDDAALDNSNSKVLGIKIVKTKGEHTVEQVESAGKIDGPETVNQVESAPKTKEIKIVKVQSVEMEKEAAPLDQVESPKKEKQRKTVKALKTKKEKKLKINPLKIMKKIAVTQEEPASTKNENTSEDIKHETATEKSVKKVKRVVLTKKAKEKTKKSVEPVEIIEEEKLNQIESSEPIEVNNTNKTIQKAIVTSRNFDENSSLTCDICFDVFGDMETFDEHMEFHNLDMPAMTGSDTMKKTIETTKVGPGDEKPTKKRKTNASTSITPPVKKVKLSDRTGDSDGEDSDVLLIDEQESTAAPRRRGRFPTQCPSCKMKFQRHKGLRLHISKKFKCSVCDSLFCKIADARSHMISEHNLHLCSRCQATFPDVVTLKEHFKGHTCPTCRKNFRYLKDHVCLFAD